jgi:large subunit ribosomal protein L22
MEVKAVAKDTGISPKKAQPVINMVRGRNVDEALTILEFTPTPIARLVSQVIKSAAANADNNFQMERTNLKIVGIFADTARTLKRHRPQPRGRAHPILKRSSHITVIVNE